MVHQVSTADWWVGDQVECAKAVRRWVVLDDKLPYGNSNKMRKKKDVVLFLSHLYLHAKDLCQEIEEDFLYVDDVCNSVVDAVFKRAPISSITPVSENCICYWKQIMVTKRPIATSDLALLLRYQSVIHSEILSHSRKQWLSSLRSDIQMVEVLNAFRSCLLLIHRSSLEQFVKSVWYETIQSIAIHFDNQNMQSNMRYL